MAVIKDYFKGIDKNYIVDGITFFMDPHDLGHKIMGVGVDEATRQVTHYVEIALSMPEARTQAGQEPIYMIGGDALAAVKLTQPIDAEDFMKIADVSRSLQTTIGKFSKGLETGADTPGQRGGRS